MSINKENHSHLGALKKSNEDIKFAKKDVVERFISILWKKEIDFHFSTK